MNGYLKKFFAEFFVMLTVMCICVADVYAAEQYNFGDFEYRVSDSGAVRICRYNGNDERVEIPSEIDGKAVVYVDGFHDNKFIKEVVFTDTVEEIASQSFFNCENLFVTPVSKF